MTMNRRRFLGNSLAAAGGAALARYGMAAAAAQTDRPASIPGSISEAEIKSDADIEGV